MKINAFLILILFSGLLLAYANHIPDAQDLRITGPLEAASYQSPAADFEAMANDSFSKLEEYRSRQIQAVVKHYCLVAYHGPSCIRWVSECGRPCAAHLPQSTLTRAMKDYQKLQFNMERTGGRK
jgi:hypothetical protein